MRTKKTVIILLSGKAGSGKSTVSEMMKIKIEDIPSMTLFQYSFARPIKVLARNFMLWDGQKDTKGRQLLQGVGRIGREYDEDVWVSHLLKQMDALAGMLPFNFVIVDDWRFPNELAYLKKNALLDVITVRLFGRRKELDVDAELDVSENSLPEISTESLIFAKSGLYDFTIDNSEDDLNYLKSKLDVVLAEITKRFILE
jgi:hypothetical protein